MKEIKWNEEKNEWLQKNRNISFEQVEELISQNQFLDKIKHPNIQRYPNQGQFIVMLNNYVHYVPFVEDDKKVFLKTIIASRKLNKKYNYDKSK